jgi:energy-coupling factor transport system permease protein
LITQVYGEKGPSALHRFDPRAKIVVLLAILVLFFLPIRVGQLAVYLIAVLLVSGIFLGIPNTLRPIRLILPILVLVLLLTPPFHRSGPVLISIRGFTVLSLPGLVETFRLIVRFTGITVIFYLFLGTTDQETLILSFRWFGAPFTVSLILGIALEYIPTILMLYNQVQDAHRLRRAGTDTSSEFAHNRALRRTPAGRQKRKGEAKGLFRRLTDTIPILTSVIVLSVRRIPTLAMALECRGVGRKNRRSSYRSLKSGRFLLCEGAIAIAVVAALAGSVVLFH